MSIWAIVHSMERIHNAAGQLNEIRGHLRTFQNAARFNPRHVDDWDILGLRNDLALRIIRALDGMARRSRRLRRAAGHAPNDSRLLNRQFTAWSDARETHGPESRQAGQTPP